VSSAGAKFERGDVLVAPEVLDLLGHYTWPGNVRELENCIERMVVLTRGSRLTSEDVPARLRQPREPLAEDLAAFELPADGVQLPELERHLIVQALRRTRGSLRPAARLLGISYKTLQYRVRKHGLEREAYEMPASAPGDPK